MYRHGVNEKAVMMSFNPIMLLTRWCTDLTVLGLRNHDLEDVKRTRPGAWHPVRLP